MIGNNEIYWAALEVATTISFFLAPACATARLSCNSCRAHSPPTPGGLIHFRKHSISVPKTARPVWRRKWLAPRTKSRLENMFLPARQPLHRHLRRLGVPRVANSRPLATKLQHTVGGRKATPLDDYRTAVSATSKFRRSRAAEASRPEASRPLFLVRSRILILAPNCGVARLPKMDPRPMDPRPAASVPPSKRPRT